MWHLECSLCFEAAELLFAQQVARHIRKSTDIQTTFAQSLKFNKYEYYLNELPYAVHNFSQGVEWYQHPRTLANTIGVLCPWRWSPQQSQADCRHGTNGWYRLIYVVDCRLVPSHTFMSASSHASFSGGHTVVISNSIFMHMNLGCLSWHMLAKVRTLKSTKLRSVVGADPRLAKYNVVGEGTLALASRPSSLRQFHTNAARCGLIKKVTNMPNLTFHTGDLCRCFSTTCILPSHSCWKFRLELLPH